MIRFLILAGYFELTMYLPIILVAQSIHPNLHLFLLGLYFHVLVLCFSSCSASDHLGQADEDPQSSLKLLGKSGEYFLALYSLCLSGYFSYSDTGFPKQFLPKATTSQVAAGSSKEIQQDEGDNNPVSQNQILVAIYQICL